MRSHAEKEMLSVCMFTIMQAADDCDITLKQAELLIRKFGECRKSGVGSHELMAKIIDWVEKVGMDAYSIIDCVKDADPEEGPAN